MKSRINSKFILDILFILTYSVGYVSLLKYVTYAIFPLPESIQLFIFLTFIYVIRFGFVLNKGEFYSGRLFVFLIVLYLWEILQGLLVGTDINSILVAIVNLLSTLIAYKYMSNIICEKSSIKPVIRAYSVYMYYTLFIITVSSLLILSHLMPQYSNQLGENSLFKTNMENQMTFYYFPGYLSVVYNTPSVFLSGLGFPSLSGLSHESQAMYFTILPALFLLYYFKKSKQIEKYILLIFFISTILTTSLTAAICFILTYSFHLLWKFRDKNQLGSAIILLVFISSIAFYVINSQFNSIIMAFFQEKANFDSDGSSGSYSLNLLLYIFSPTGVLGQGIFSSTADQAKQLSLNCGYISSLMILSFYLYFIFTSIRNIFSSEILCHAIGLASLYFIAHSFKYGVQVFNNCNIFFIIFLLSYAERFRKERKQRSNIII